MTVLQDICRYLISEECARKNHTVTELSIQIGVTEQSVRTAVKRGLKMQVLNNESHGNFKLYSLGKHGKLIASLPVKYKTYADLNSTLQLISNQTKK